MAPRVFGSPAFDRHSFAGFHHDHFQHGRFHRRFIVAGVGAGFYD
jgi:hypothetical protein